MTFRVTVWILKSQISIAEIETGINDESKNYATISIIFLLGGVEYCLKKHFFFLPPSYLAKGPLDVAVLQVTFMLDLRIWIWVFLIEKSECEAEEVL